MDHLFLLKALAVMAAMAEMDPHHGMALVDRVALVDMVVLEVLY
jgi:hypothetical protein